MTKPELKARIIARLEKMQADLRETIAGIEWWNANRTEERPFDVGFDKSMLQCVDMQLAGWEAGDMQEVNRWADRMKALTPPEQYP